MSEVLAQLEKKGGGAVDFSKATLTNLCKRTYNSNMTMNVNVGDYIILISESTSSFERYLEGATIITQCQATPVGDDGAMAICLATASSVVWRLGGTTRWGAAFRMEF